MKTMTCKDMGGSCDAKMTAGSSEEMIKMGMDHAHASHPELVETMKGMSAEETATWNADMTQKFEDADMDTESEDMVVEDTEEEGEEESSESESAE